MNDGNDGNGFGFGTACLGALMAALLFICISGCSGCSGKSKIEALKESLNELSSCTRGKATITLEVGSWNTVAKFTFEDVDMKKFINE